MSFSFELASYEQPKTTLWMGELESWMDEQYIQQLWFNLNEKVMVKVIRDKITGISAGYAFVDFSTAASARLVMSRYNGVLMSNSLKQFKLNWASGGGLIDRREDRQPEYSIFVGDLSPEITEINLLSVFRTRYISCKSAKIMTDPRTRMTRGYGFVRFTEFMDQQRALIEMQGYFLGSRAIRVSVATPKNKSPFSASTSNSSLLASPNKSPLQSPLLHHLDTTNTTVFVGGLSAPIREDELRQYFQHFGEIVYVKIPPGKGCGFVQYVSRTCAELAIEQMNGYQIGNSRIRLSWGRSQNEKVSSTPTQMNLNQNILPSSLYQPVYPAISSVAQQDFISMQNTSYTSDLNFLPNDTTTDDFIASLLLNNEKNRKVDWRLNQIYAQ
ncbi:hypothetical protein BDF21DRAFT_383431 [Thamnidium elegans]|uniref:RRM domain-containing protein n=1 Tax=Thamnidium elegans TaxID=101142 RepID=A0A8H7SHK3_9FUNG|nr:hypothetical protein INT48_004183 [Thamnidium elegans]KAI8079287.1 hypothetical protein BDF21DRAFT_383431 [Thamnidium elegans]